MKKLFTIALAALMLLASVTVLAETRIPAETTDEPVHLEGYSIGDQSGDTLSKWIGFNDDNPAEVETYTFQLTTYGAAYHDGYVYGYVYGYNESGELNCDFYVMDVETHFVNYPGGNSGGEFVLGMAFNRADGNMYALVDEDHPYIATVDLETGALERVVNINLGNYLGIYCFAIDDDGNFYGINMSAVSAKLLSINIANGALSVIGDTGLQCYYAQSMTYDSSTGRIYWAESDGGAHSCLFWLDPATGAATSCGQIGPDGIEVTCLYTITKDEPIDNPTPEPTDDPTPEPTEPAVLPGDVDLNGTVAVTDAILAMRYSMGLISLEADQLLAGDVSGDGEVRIDDALIILRAAMGIIEL